MSNQTDIFPMFLDVCDRRDLIGTARWTAWHRTRESILSLIAPRRPSRDAETVILTEWYDVRRFTVQVHDTIEAGHVCMFCSAVDPDPSEHRVFCRYRRLSHAYEASPAS